MQLLVKSQDLPPKVREKLVEFFLQNRYFAFVPSALLRLLTQKLYLHMLQKSKRKKLMEQRKTFNFVFESVEKYLNKLKMNVKVVAFFVITKLNEEELKELQLDETYK